MLRSWTPGVAVLLCAGAGQPVGGGWADELAPLAASDYRDPEGVVGRDVGSASISASVDRTEATTVQSVTLTVVVTSMSPGTVQLSPNPVAGQPLGDFMVAWVRRDPPGLDGGAVTHRWVVGLEPYLPGMALVPPISAVTPDAESAVGRAEAVGTPLVGGGATTDPIEVRIVTVLEEGPRFEPGRVREPLDPLPVPRTASPAGWIVPAAGAVAAAGLGAVGFIALRPTPARRVRRAFDPLLRRADILMSAGRADSGASAVWRAEEAVGLIREAAVLALGPVARALTSGELAGALAGFCSAHPAGFTRELSALLAWHDVRGYSGRDCEPPTIPDIAGTVRAIQAASLAAARIAAPATGRRRAR